MHPDIAQLLRSKGFRATAGRIAIMRLIRTAKGPLSVEDISRKVPLNTVTLYRALEDFVVAGILLRGIGRDGVARFSSPRHHHHHMVCSDCGYASACSLC